MLCHSRTLMPDSVRPKAGTCTCLIAHTTEHWIMLEWGICSECWSGVDLTAHSWRLEALRTAIIERCPLAPSTTSKSGFTRGMKSGSVSHLPRADFQSFNPAGLTSLSFLLDRRNRTIHGT